MKAQAGPWPRRAELPRNAGQRVPGAVYPPVYRESGITVIGVFFAISPIIALVARMKKGFWLALVFAEIYLFAGLFASMSNALKMVYPMTAVFNLSGYYNANIIQVLIGVVVLLACVVLSLFILKGLNKNAK